MVYFIESTINTTSTTTSGGQTGLSDAVPVKTALPSEPALDELQKLSRDLTAIRLQVDKYFQSSKTSEEWQLIGMVIDRLLFGLYILFILVSFITIMGIWIWNNTYAA